MSQATTWIVNTHCGPQAGRHNSKLCTQYRVYGRINTEDEWYSRINDRVVENHASTQACSGHSSNTAYTTIVLRSEYPSQPLPSRHVDNRIRSPQEPNVYTAV